jgi:hypothetical protein
MSTSVPDRAYDQPDRAAEHYLRKRLPLGASELPVERYFDALQHMRHMPQYSLAARRALPSRAQLEGSGVSYIADAAVLGTWEFLGPQNIGGRVRALVIHPTQPSVMWAAAVGGGVWKSTNGGTSWFPLSDLLPNIAVTSLTLDPTNPNVLYAGTGEGYQVFVEGKQGKMIRGAGIFRSSDGGMTWTRLNATVNSNFFYVNDIIVSKVSGLRIYAATKTGVWRSLDGGIAWTRVLNPNLSNGCGDLVIVSKSPDDLVFASCGLGLDQASIWRHTKAQGAGAWTKVLTEPAMGRTTLAIAPSNPTIVYALASSRNPAPEVFGAFHALFRSASSGAAGSWVAQASSTSPNPLTRSLLTNPVVALCGNTPRVLNQGWYDNAIAVDPKNPNRLWAGGIDLFRSDDGGKTWGIASSWWSAAKWAPVKVPRVYAHADQHAIVFHPQYNGTTNKMLYVANDGGVFMTVNATAAVGKTTASVCNPNGIGVSWQKKNALGNTQFYHGAPWPDGSEFFGGTQDNGTNYSRVGFPAGWLELLSGDGGYTAIGSSYLFAATIGLSLQRSTDGENWEPITGNIADGALFIAPYALDPANGERLVLGGTRVWRTENSGTTWAPISNPLSPQGISAVTVFNGGVIAGTPEGSLVTGTGGAQPRQGYVSSVAYDPNNVGVGYATYSTFGGFHVWKTSDNGVTWQPIDGSGTASLPDVPVHSIVVDPVDSQWLYVGTDVGVFLSTDGGSTWAIENTGFPNVVVEWLAINQEAPQYLFAFTHGRSAWRVLLPPAQ